MGNNNEFDEEMIDDIAEESELEAEEIAEEAETVEDAEVSDEDNEDHEAEEKPAKKSMGNIAVFGLLAVCLAAVIGFAVSAHYKKAEVPVQNTEVHVGLSDPLSKESIKKALSEDLIPSYEFLLYGTHNAVDPNNTDKIRTFQFGNNGDYFGYSSAENDDLGTYELYVEDDQIKLKIVCNRVTDKYVVELSDQGDLVLKGDKVFVLYEK